jgi:hypothetical protein
MDRLEPLKRPLTPTVNACFELTTVNTVNKWRKSMIHKGIVVNDSVNSRPLINAPLL